MIETARSPAPHPTEPGGPTGDSALLVALAERRPGAFEALVEAYQRPLFGLAWRLTGSPQDAEEAVQDAFERAHRALYRRYSPERVHGLALRAWLYTIAVNAARNVARARRVRGGRETESTDGLAAEPVAPGPTPPEVAEQSELGRLLELALLELPPRYRDAVVLRWVQGLTYDEVAQALGRPLGTVKSDVHRGLRLLRRQLGPRLERETPEEARE